MSIPVIGAPVVNNPYWIHRLVMSVDYPVDNFVIINNNGRGEIDEELDRIAKSSHNFINKIKVCHMPANIGCVGAWNLIIKCYMMSPYWVIVNDDVAFGRGLLKEMAESVQKDPEVGLVHAYPGNFELGSWDMFLIRDHVIETLGLFDENTYPAYCDDADYIMRILNSNIKRIISLEGNYFHGNGNKDNYYEEGSQTSKSSEVLGDKLNTANEVNCEYMKRKWGDTWHMCQPKKLPFNGEVKLGSNFYDLKFVRTKHTGF